MRHVFPLWSGRSPIELGSEAPYDFLAQETSAGKRLSISDEPGEVVRGVIRLNEPLLAGLGFRLVPRICPFQSGARRRINRLEQRYANPVQDELCGLLKLCRCDDDWSYYFDARSQESARHSHAVP
jgi:hypothetical protein